MKKTILLLIVIISYSTIYGQVSDLEKANNLLNIQKELTFSFQVSNHKDVNLFLENLSIVNYSEATKTVTAWVGSSDLLTIFTRHCTFGFPYFSIFTKFS